MSTLRTPLALALWSGLLLGTNAVAGPSETRRIPADHATIQEAIDAANPGDLLLVSPGAHSGFTLTKPLTIRSEGGSAQSTIITSPVQVLTLDASGANLEHLIIDGAATLSGPGLTIEEANATIRNCTIRDWRGSATAGGVLLAHTDTRLIDCTITGNQFGQEALVQEGAGGGGISAYGGSPRLIRCTISGNTTIDGQAITHAATHGGGNGAGLFFRDSSPTIINCTITDNHTGNGGSDTGCDQFFHNGPGTPGGSGGGIAMEGATAVIINTLIAANTTGAGGDGGECPPRPGGDGGSGAGVSVTGGHARLINCTVVGNSTGRAGAGPAGAGGAGEGGGISARSATVIIDNSILWDNEAVGAGLREAQLVANSATITASCIMGGGFDGRGNFALDPGFVDPERGDYRLAANSACIDAGDTTRTPPWVTTDLAGENRFSRDPESAATGLAAPGNGPEIVDVGAHEFQGVSCYADCDGNTSSPRLSVDDFTCFINRFAAADPRANCDGSTSAPVLTIDDFHCFISRYAAGCP